MNQSMKREIITRTAESEVTNGSVQGESRLANDIEPPAGPWRWAKLLSFFFWLRVLPCVFRYCREFLCLRYSKLKMQKKKTVCFFFSFRRFFFIRPIQGRPAQTRKSRRRRRRRRRCGMRIVSGSIVSPAKMEPNTKPGPVQTKPNSVQPSTASFKSHQT